jgi:transcriptional regulator with XRE-family HTH domain
LIREARNERKMTAQELADRAGISRGMLQRIEKGNPKCEIGAVFEAAAIVDVRLFDADENALAEHLHHNGEKLVLLPKSVRKKNKTVRDDF